MLERGHEHEQHVCPAPANDLALADLVQVHLAVPGGVVGLAGVTALGSAGERHRVQRLTGGGRRALERRALERRGAPDLAGVAVRCLALLGRLRERASHAAHGHHRASGHGPLQRGELATEVGDRGIRPVLDP